MLSSSFAEPPNVRNRSEGVESSAFSDGVGGCVDHCLWRLSMDGEAGGVSQRLLPGVRGGAAGGAGADVRRGAHFLDPDPASGILETLGMHGVREGSACNDEDAAGVQVGWIIYSGARRVHFLGGFPRAGRGGGILDWTDRGAGGCSATAAASAAHAEGADVESEAGSYSTCNGYHLPVLWGAIVGAWFAMFVPGVRSGGERGGAKLETRKQRRENC